MDINKIKQLIGEIEALKRQTEDKERLLQQIASGQAKVYNNHVREKIRHVIGRVKMGFNDIQNEMANKYGYERSGKTLYATLYAMTKDKELKRYKKGWMVKGKIE